MDAELADADAADPAAADRATRAGWAAAFVTRARGHRNAAGCTVSFAAAPLLPGDGVSEPPRPSRSERIAAARARLIAALCEAITSAGSELQPG